MIDAEKVSKVLSKSAQLDVLIHLMNVGEDYLSGIAKATGYSHSSVPRVLTPLIEQGIVHERVLGRQLKIFRINNESEIVQSLRCCFEEISDLVK